MLEKGIAPFRGVLAVHVLKREHGKPVVIAAAHRIQNQPVTDRHRALSYGN
jgi:hypothetical protein